MDFSSESKEDKLDDDFRRVLCIIKQYIQYINSNHHLSLYRSWLEKLSTVNDEKLERNMYLFELARQIKCNKLLPPFNRHPPIGSLRSLPKINFFRPSDMENIFYDSAQCEKEPTNIMYSEPLPPPQDFLEQNFSYPQQQFIRQNQGSIQLPSSVQNLYEFQDNYMHTLFMQPRECYYHPCYAEDGSDTPLERVKTPIKIKKRKSKNARSIQKFSIEDNTSRSIINQKNEPQDMVLAKSAYPSEQETGPTKERIVQEVHSVKDDSSWCDLTDASQTSVSILASGDNQKSPPKVQDKVRQFNVISKALEQSQIPSQIKESRQDLYGKSKLNLSEEAEKINRKFQNFSEMKVSLKDTNFISSDWKKTIESLQLRLTETLNQNNELKSIINALQLKLKEETSKNKEQNEAKQKKCELRKKEIESLQQIQVDNIKKLEKSFHAKLNEAERSYQQKIEKLKANYETKIKELQSKGEHSKKDRNREMSRISEIIQQQCVRMSNEIAALRSQIENAFSNYNGDEKIIVLQKCVSKMDRLFQRSEKEYQKQIEKLKQELDLKDKVMQIQLKTQRAELVARTSVEKQRQFDEVINNLEIKYIKMLEYHESQVKEIKEQDEEKIEHLKHLLEENNIAYDNIL